MGGDEKKSLAYQPQYPASAPPPPAYGTFQGQGSLPYPAPPPVIGYPQPIPPPGTTSSSSSAVPQYYGHGYQNIHATIELHPVRVPRLPCCGIGLGWFLFILGFFFASIPWYVGAFLFFFSVVDRREKPGYAACTIAAALALVLVIVGATADT